VTTIFYIDITFLSGHTNEHFQHRMLRSPAQYDPSVVEHAAGFFC
jgi:hypothetical protein